MIERLDQPCELNRIVLARIFRHGPRTAVMLHRKAEVGKIEKVVAIADRREQCNRRQKNRKQAVPAHAMHPPPVPPAEPHQRSHTDPKPK